MSRISLASIKARLAATAAVTAIADIKIGSSFDADYMTEFGKTFPQVWAVAQRQIPMDDGRGFSGQARQTLKVEILVRIVVRREAPDGNPYDPEAKLDELQNAVVGALFGWTPPGAREHLTWASSEDGPPWESATSADLRFTTFVADARNVT